MSNKPDDAPVAESPPREPAAKAELTGPQRALQRLGLVRAIDLALHLPLRYEDETQVTTIARSRTRREGAGRGHRRSSRAWSSAGGASSSPR